MTQSWPGFEPVPTILFDSTYCLILTRMTPELDFLSPNITSQLRRIMDNNRITRVVHFLAGKFIFTLILRYFTFNSI